jgi:crossover junction endodeoxyribonuclease RuvC
MGSTQALTVLGLDPGSRYTGYGFITERSGTLQLVEAGVITLTSRKDICERLGLLFNKLSHLLDIHTPDEVAVENVFVSKNVMSALKLGQARGAALATCAGRGLPVHSYEPTLVKKSIVGVGRAQKSQVAFMVGQLLNTKETWREDASDALAVAVCHCNERRMRRLARMA